MRTLADDEEDASTSGPASASASQQPAWMRTLHDRSKEWLEQLPQACFFALSTDTRTYSATELQHVTEAVWRQPGPAIPAVRARGGDRCKVVTLSAQRPCGYRSGLQGRAQADEPSAHIDELSHEG